MSDERIDILYSVTSSLSLVLLRGQLSYLRAAGFHPAVVCGPGPTLEAMRATESIPVFTIEMNREISPLKDLVALVRASQLVRHLRPLIANSGTPKAGLLVGLAAWFNRVPCRIYTLRGLRVETTSGPKRWLLRLTERIACACAHRVICVSPSLRQRAVELGVVPAGKAIVLASGSSNGVDPSRFSSTPQGLANAAEVRRQLGIDQSRAVIGYVGRLTRDKGVPELMAAFELVRQRFPSAVLLLVGSYEPGDPVPPETRAAIELDANVIRVDFTSEIATYYFLMDMLVLPTHREGFPNVVLEAQAASRPVVTTRATGASDSVCDGVTGLVVPVGDVVALANALMKLLSDRDLAQQMGRAGRERVIREFSREKIWEALAELYRDLLQQRGLPAPAKQDSAMCMEER
ncbi:MAG: glycosyltransferase family 4 protein [Candidatus Korobacteraceae bacterium]